MSKDYKGKLRDEAVVASTERRRRSGRSFVFTALFLAIRLSTTIAFAPPHENHTTFESAVQYRRRHNITFTYTPTDVHPEVCKYLTEEDCQHADASVQIHRATHEYNQRLLEANPNFQLNILVLLLQFTDHADRELPEPYEYQILLNLRVAEYLKVNSYGTYRVWFDVIPWQMTDNTELHYSFGKSGRTKEFQKSFHPLLDKLWDDPEMDFSIYDNNGDGILDNLMVLTSSYPAEWGDVDCTNGRTDSDRIWSHALASIDEDNWVSKDGSLRSNGYTIGAALFGTCGSTPAEMGVITHEYFHSQYDLPDLYDTELNEDGAFRYRGKGGAGSFDIMSNPYGVGQNFENFPSHLSAWSKVQMGFVNPTPLNQGTLQATYTLRPAETHPDVLKINLENFFGYEYLLIENRQRKLFDIKLFGEGIAIYHVDDSYSSQSYRGFPGQDGWPGNARHYQVAVLQADGRYDLEQFVNRGDAGDFWQPGMTLGPNNDGETYPSTDTYGSLSGVALTGVEIQIVEQIGDDIVISVTIPASLMGAPPKPEDIDESLFATRPKETPGPFPISGQFQANWFRNGEGGKEDIVDAVPPQEPGMGFVERPPREDDSASTNDASGVGVGTVERPSGEQGDLEQPADNLVIAIPDNGEDATSDGSEEPVVLEDPPSEGGIFEAAPSEGGIFEAVDKEPFVAREPVNATEPAPVNGTEPEKPAEDDIENIDNDGGDGSVFAGLFTNSSKEEIDGEVANDTQTGGTNAVDDSTISPTQEMSMGGTLDSTMEEEMSAATRVREFNVWGYAAVLSALVLLAK